MNFKENLEELFNGFEASPMLFIGSGISRRYIELECWLDLLKRFTKKIDENHVKINADANSDLPEYASVLAEIYHNKWWNIPENKDIQKEYEEYFINRQSALKIEISHYLKNIDISSIVLKNMKMKYLFLNKLLLMELLQQIGIYYLKICFQNSQFSLGSTNY